jgi:galactofuranose transport system ATP-binding protein
MTVEPLLRMSGINKTFGPVQALRGAAFEVGPGEVMALIGQNGAGKSTLIKVLNGFLARDAGEIVFDGRPWSAGSPQEAQRSGVSTIFQEINLIPLRSVTENIYLGREIRNRAGFLAWRRMDKGAVALLKEFDVSLDVRRPLGDSSTAVQQMVAIARAVSFNAKLVVMDESTSSLADHEVRVLFQTIRRLKSQGVSVVFVSHKLDELFEVCDRVTVMRDGEYVSTDDIVSVDAATIVRRMVGREVSTLFPKTQREPGRVVLSVRSLTRTGVFDDV